MLDASLLPPRRYLVAGHTYATKLLADIHAARIGAEVVTFELGAADFQPLPVLRNVLVRYFVVTSGPLDIRVEYIDGNGAVRCDLGECIDGGWKWHFATVLPADVEEAAGNALLNWPHAMPGYGGTETGQQARNNAEAFCDREIGPDPVLATEAR